MNANEREYPAGNITEEAVNRAIRQRRRLWLDVLLLAALFAVAFAVRVSHTRGDLWQDEAEYALASTHGVADQRWDRSDVASEPLRLVRLRHFHPPMTAYLLRAAQVRGNDERALRTPFVIAGSLVVCLVYLCGLRLFGERRDVSLACAVIVLVTPLQIRASSHAIPWAEISLGIMALLWTLLQFIHTRQWGWLIGTCGVFGWLFCATESFFPILLAALLSLPFLFDRTVQSDENTHDTDAFSPRRRTSLSQPRNLFPGRPTLHGLPTLHGRIAPLHGALPHGRSERRKMLTTFGIGAFVFLMIVLILWPAGLFGGAWGNIQHYAHLPADTIAAVVGGVSRRPIPKWAYLYWFSHDYKPYFVLYVLGIGAVAWQITKRRLSRSASVLLILTAVEVAVAHLTVEFGPQYLAHCLPLLTLLTGLCFYELAQAADRVYSRRPEPAAQTKLNGRAIVPVLVPVGMLLTCAYLARWQVRPELRITDEEAQVSRWPDAARFLAARWQTNDRLVIGPQPVVVPRWYLLVGEKLPIRETQIGELPQGRTRLPGLQRMKVGEVRFAVVNSTFDGNPIIDEDVRKLLATWPMVYRSPEPTGIPSRLVIYERP